jgi:hypothetical protein
MNKIEVLVCIYLFTIQLVLSMPTSNSVEQKEECERLMDAKLASGLTILHDSASANEIDTLEDKKLKDCFDIIMKNSFGFDPEQEEGHGDGEGISIDSQSEEEYSDENTSTSVTSGDDDDEEYDYNYEDEDQKNEPKKRKVTRK